MSVSYELRDVGMRYDESTVLAGVTLSFNHPELVSIAGPNGAGKSTLLGIMAGLRPGYDGECRVNGVEVGKWRRRDFARRVAFVPQSLKLDFPFTAEEVVLMGRTPHAGGLFESQADHDAAERAMEITDTLKFRSRNFRSLSGGERQRVVLASALAQAPKALLLDEPVTFLDLEHQLSVYRILRQLAHDGILVISITHDLNLAATFSDRVIALRNGRILADAGPCDALSADSIRAVFSVEAEWMKRSNGQPWIAYGS